MKRGLIGDVLGLLSVAAAVWVVVYVIMGPVLQSEPVTAVRTAEFATLIWTVCHVGAIVRRSHESQTQQHMVMLAIIAGEKYATQEAMDETLDRIARNN